MLTVAGPRLTDDGALLLFSLSVAVDGLCGAGARVARLKLAGGTIAKDLECEIGRTFEEPFSAFTAVLALPAASLFRSRLIFVECLDLRV